MTLRIHHLAFRTRDLPTLVRFYVDVLALPVVRETPGYSTWLQIGDGVLMIEARRDDEPTPTPGSMELVAFAVSPGERRAVIERLRARNVALEHETAATTYFRDPEGRRVAVSTYVFASS